MQRIDRTEKDLWEVFNRGHVPYLRLEVSGAHKWRGENRARLVQRPAEGVDPLFAQVEQGPEGFCTFVRDG
jgi:hypothetical protein